MHAANAEWRHSFLDLYEGGAHQQWKVLDPEDLDVVACRPHSVGILRQFLERSTVDGVDTGCLADARRPPFVVD